MVDGNRKIMFSSTIEADEGSYTCKAVNKVGAVAKEMSLKFKSKFSIKLYS